MTDRDTPGGAQPGDDNLANAGGPVGGERDQIERAERRGLGRGTLLGLGLAVLVVLVTAVVLFWWNPFADAGPAPDNTVPVTSLPAASVEPTSSIPVATATIVPPPSPPSPPTSTAPAPPPPTATDIGTLALNRWNWLPEQRAFSVGGFIDGSESGGACTLTATNGPVTFIATADATADANTTVCVVNLHSPDIASGEWQLVMTYDGPSGQAVSGPVTVTVP